MTTLDWIIVAFFAADGASGATPQGLVVSALSLAASPSAPSSGSRLGAAAARRGLELAYAPLFSLSAR